jgi:branched-chain amino acid transport system permease protein
MAFLGGLGTIVGPILGALLLEPTQQYFTLQFGQSGFYLVIYGALFLVVLLLLPQGVVPTLRARWTRFQATRSQQEEVAVSDTESPRRGEPRDTERKEGINL